MKRKIFAATAVACILIVALTALAACDSDKLLDSSWELAAVANAQGEIIACGEDYAYDASVKRIAVTCTVSGEGEIVIVYADGGKTLKGQLTETSTGADGEERYSVKYADGSIGTAVYVAKKDNVYPSDTDADDKYDVSELYELTLTVGEEYTLYFARVSSIKQ